MIENTVNVRVAFVIIILHFLELFTDYSHTQMQDIRNPLFLFLFYVKIFS
jgi:hypothetical protein